MTLAEFLRARLDEDERMAVGAYGRSWMTDAGDDPGQSWVLTEDMHLCEASPSRTTSTGLPRTWPPHTPMTSAAATTNGSAGSCTR